MCALIGNKWKIKEEKSVNHAGFGDESNTSTDGGFGAIAAEGASTKAAADSDCFG